MDMPHLVMRQILDIVGFLAILNLRRTCKSCRNFIDDVKPINDLKAIRIHLTHYRIRVKLVLKRNEIAECFCVSYQDETEDNSCLIIKDKACLINKGFLNSQSVGRRDEHFVDSFFNDFEFIIKNQRSKLTDLEITAYSFTRFSEIKITADEKNCRHLKIANKMLDRFEQILESRPVPLEVQNLHLTAFNPSQIFQISRFIKANSLRGFQAYQFGLSKKEYTILDAIPKYENFKNLEYLGLHFPMTNPFSDFSDVSELFLTRDTFSKNYIMILKQVFLANSRLKTWEVKFKNLEEGVIIRDILRDLSDDPDGYWFFEVPSPDEDFSIDISITYSDCIIFT